MLSKPSRQKASTVRVPAPIKGIDGKNPLSMMDQLSAIAMTNCIPRTNGVAYRKGSKHHQVGVSAGYVERLLPYKGRTTATSKLFAAAAGVIYDTSAAGGTPSSAVTGLTANTWNHVNFGTQGGLALVIANGADAVRSYNGTSWTTWTQVGGSPGYGQVQNVSPLVLKNVLVHQKRLWFTERDSSKIWYLPIDSVGGVANSLDVAGYLVNGGSLVALASWTTDAGVGTDDHLVAFSSNGDVVVFEGTDPSSSTAWSLVGTWTIGRPIGQQCVDKYGSDLVVLTVDGVIELKRALLGSDETIEPTTSDSIATILNDLIRLFGDLDGWQVISSPEEKLLIVNVPQIDRAQNFQFVMDMTLQSWSTITGFAAQHWVSWNNKLYFSANQKVVQAYAANVFLDGVAADGSGGTTYDGVIHAAYSNFRSPTNFKMFSLVRPIFQSGSANPSIQAAIKTDFSLQDVFGASLPGASTNAGLWNTSLWDQAVWSGAVLTYQQWTPVIGSGYNASILLKIISTAELYWVATDWVFEVGGTL